MSKKRTSGQIRSYFDFSLRPGLLTCDNRSLSSFLMCSINWMWIRRMADFLWKINTTKDQTKNMQVRLPSSPDLPSKKDLWSQWDLNGKIKVHKSSIKASEFSIQICSHWRSCMTKIASFCFHPCVAPKSEPCALLDYIRCVWKGLLPPCDQASSGWLPIKHAGPFSPETVICGFAPTI